MKELLVIRGQPLADTEKALKEAQSKTQQLEIIAKQLQAEIDRLRSSSKPRRGDPVPKISMGKIEAFACVSQYRGNESAVTV